MAGEKGSGGRKIRTEKTGSDRKKKSGWVKPDGTPLRKRKGNYFPDDEINKRKPAQRSKTYSRTVDDRGSRPTDRKPDTGSFDPSKEKRSSYRSGEKSGYSREDKRPGGEGEKSFSRRSGDAPGSRRSFPDKEKRFKKEDDNRKPSYPSERSFRKEGDDAKSSFPRKEKGFRDSDDKNKKSFTGRDSGFRKEGTDRKKPFETKSSGFGDRDKKFERKGTFKKSGNDPGYNKTGNYKKKTTASSDNSEKTDGIRLNKFIANAGICSRREADDLITAGVISINGVVVTELGTKVLAGDEVKFHDRTLKTENMVYVLLNKPKDYITTTDDPEERKTVMNLVREACKERIFPVGRLDRNTTGLLLLTNDGELTKKLTHPSSNIKKIYQVDLDSNLKSDDMIRAAEGVELEDGIAAVDEIHYESPSEKNVIGVELHSGRNRVVRRIFEAMGYKVRKLDRVYFAGLTKKDLPRGRWRFLTELEINMLKMQTGKKRTPAGE